MRVLLITADDGFAKWFSHEERAVGDRVVLTENACTRRARRALGRSDVVVIDAAVLPSPDSVELNDLHALLRDKRILAVVSEGDKANVRRLRASFIVGAADVVPKLESVRELRRLFRIPSPGARGSGGQYGVV